MSNPISSKARFDFIDVLRGPAAILVAWEHLGVIWPFNHNINWLPSDLFHTYFSIPAGAIGDFGAVGVGMFFLASGFGVVHATQRGERWPFLIKRLLRIYPPLVVSIFVIVLANKLAALYIGRPTDFSDATWREIFSSMSLANFVNEAKAINGVAWTLLIEITFYVFTWAFFPWMKNRPLPAMFSFVLFYLAMLLSANAWGQYWHMYAANCAYVGLMGFGMGVYYLWTKQVKARWIALFYLAIYLIFIQNLISVLPNFYRSNAYPVTIVYSVTFFYIVLYRFASMESGPVLGFLARTSYSIYLYNGSIGYLALTVFTPKIGYTAAFVVAFILSLVVAYLSWRLVEVQCGRVGRWLFAPKPAPVPSIAPTA